MVETTVAAATMWRSLSGADIPVVARSAGHSFAGYSVNDGLVIDATAFVHRDTLFLLSMDTAWADDDPSELIDANLRWLDDLYEAPPAVIIAATVLFVSGIMTSSPTMWAHPAKAPAAVRSRYIGASQAIFGLGLAIGPVIGVWVWSTSHNGVWLFCLVVGLAAAACAVGGLWEPRPPRGPAGDPPAVRATEPHESAA